MTKSTLVVLAGIGFAVAIALAPPVSARQGAGLAAPLRARIDEAAAQVLVATGVPSLSIAASPTAPSRMRRPTATSRSAPNARRHRTCATA